jgi:hypothetical protein
VAAAVSVVVAVEDILAPVPALVLVAPVPVLVAVVNGLVTPVFYMRMFKFFEIKKTHAHSISLLPQRR